MNSAQIIAENVFQPSQFASLAEPTLQMTTTSVSQLTSTSEAVSKAATSIPWGKILFWVVVAALVLYAAKEIADYYERKNQQKNLV